MGQGGEEGGEEGAPTRLAEALAMVCTVGNGDEEADGEVALETEARGRGVLVRVWRPFRAVPGIPAETDHSFMLLLFFS